MCSLGRGNVFSFSPNVFSFGLNVFSFGLNVFTFGGNVFSLAGQVFSEEVEKGERSGVESRSRPSASSGLALRGRREDGQSGALGVGERGSSLGGWGVWPGFAGPRLRAAQATGPAKGKAGLTERRRAVDDIVRVVEARRGRGDRRCDAAKGSSQLNVTHYPQWCRFRDHSGRTSGPPLCLGRLTIRRLAVAITIAIVASLVLVMPAAAQWPTTCVELNDLAEAAAGPPSQCRDLPAKRKPTVPPSG